MKRIFHIETWWEAYLMYAMVGTRLDIAFAVSVVSRYLHNPKKQHCDLVRHIFKYLRIRPTKNLYYKYDSSINIDGWCDASYANNVDCKSTSGFVFTCSGAAISWVSKMVDKKFGTFVENMT